MILAIPSNSNSKFPIPTPMANENQASYAKIGFFIVLGAALITATLVYLGGVGSDKHLFLAETFFSESVSGLDIGSPVNYRGVRVGSVRRISFIRAEYEGVSREDGDKIYVEMAFDTRLFRIDGHRAPSQVLELMVEKGLHATVSASGVTGLSRIELNYPRGEIKEERHTWRAAHVVIPPEPSILQSAADSAQQILNQLNKMDFVAVYSNVLDVARGATEALGTFNTVLTSEQGGIADILSNVRDASSSLRDFADQVKANPSSLLRSYTPARLDETR